jgi:radical SAM superfamily enzyme YgiQ (UPF0313 family)
MNIVLISPYEIGRQPFNLAEPAAWLARAGFAVQCLDLSLGRLDERLLAEADLVAVYLAMHTATRIAARALPRIRALAPRAHLAAYGLYAPMNAGWLREMGVATVLGGESEPDLLALAERLRDGGHMGEPSTQVRRERIGFITPARDGLPPLARYAHLLVPDGAQKTVAFTEATRGCKHLCRHCPVVPVYEGRFLAVPAEVVLADIRQQVAMGAEHVSFGDPDFFNGPTHALRIVRALHAEFPEISYDATIKIEHLIQHAQLLPELRATGCLFIISAVESADDAVLDKLAKGHTRADFHRAVALTRAAGIALAPTFVPFTPWTTLESYRALLADLVGLGLVMSVPPIQLAIRLLVPAGSKLLELPGFADLIGPFDDTLLGYPWRNADARVDELQSAIMALVERTAEAPRARVFAEIWRLVHAALGEPAPTIPDSAQGADIPRLSEPWYCCAEPTGEQLQCV